MIIHDTIHWMWIPEWHYLIWCKFEPMDVNRVGNMKFHKCVVRKAGYSSHAAYLSRTVEILIL